MVGLWSKFLCTILVWLNLSRYKVYHCERVQLVDIGSGAHVWSSPLLLDLLINELVPFCLLSQHKSASSFIEKWSKRVGHAEGKRKGRSKAIRPRGEQNVIGADATDRRQRHRSDSSADQMSRGRRSDFALRSEDGAVHPWFFFYGADKTTSYVWVLFKKKKKGKTVRFKVGFQVLMGISTYFSLRIF